tara:strand:+ start:94 stop:381 length:288 start_codon:yes stop_codon:yes gene_type:complete
MPKFKPANNFSENFKKRSPFQVTDLKVKRGGKLERTNYLEDLISEKTGEAVKEDVNDLTIDEKTELEELRQFYKENTIEETDDVDETPEQSQESK